MKTKWKLSTEQKSKILYLYKHNVSQNQIAKKLNVDHSTIHYHLKKNNIELRVRTIKIKEVPVEIFYDEFGDKINTGKSYKEYLQENRRRKIITITPHVTVDFTKYF